MPEQLKGKRVAALVTKGFEQVELLEPRAALEAAGATDQARADDYDALLLPGGVMSPDHLRMNRKAVDLVRQVFDDGRPIAVICHGPWTLVEAGVVKGLTITSYPSLKTDLQNAGANWVDEQVVVDRGIVSSRRPGDLPAFNQKMIEEFAEGQHGGAGTRRRAASEPRFSTRAGRAGPHFLSNPG